MSDLEVVVLGAGVVGLTTAIQLQRRFRNAHVHLIADKFTAHTTSNVAAGLFRPGTSFSGPSKHIARKWIRDSYKYWEDICATSNGPNIGVTRLSGYIFSSINEAITRNHYIEDIVPLYRRATEEELELCPGNWKYGSFFSTVLTECRIYLPWAMHTFKQSGGTVTSKTITSFSEVPKSDIIVNCTGLGAKYLCNDHKLVPMRGQVVKVCAPFVKTFFYADYDTYIIPGFESVTLGGCRQFDSYDMSISCYDSMAIKDRCTKLIPSLRSASVIGEYVGLRPHRDPVRVEKEVINIAGRKIRVVHNYGHGGYGVTTAPGTSLHAIKLVTEMLAGNSKL